jgi:hypothetical protein
MTTTEPKITCPIIDEAKRHAKSAIAELKRDETDRSLTEWLLEQVDGSLEEIRSSNEQLRAWGHELQQELESMKKGEVK